jgi:hypothetical protein
MKKLKIESDTIFQIISEIPGYTENICNWIPKCVRCSVFWECEKVEGERWSLLRLVDEWRYEDELLEEENFLPTGEEDHPENDLIQYETYEEQTDFIDKNDSDTLEDIQHEMDVERQENEMCETDNPKDKEKYKYTCYDIDFCLWFCGCGPRTGCNNEMNSSLESYDYTKEEWNKILFEQNAFETDLEIPENDSKPYL